MQSRRGRHERKSESTRRVSIAAYALTGVVICVSVAVMLLTGSQHLSSINGGGAVYDFFEFEYGSGKFQQQNGICSVNAVLRVETAGFGYLYVDAAIPGENTIDAKISFSGGSAEPGAASELQVKLKPGENVFSVPENMNFTAVSISFPVSAIPSGEGMPEIESLQLRAQKKTAPVGRVISLSISLMCVYAAVMVLVRILAGMLNVRITILQPVLNVIEEMYSAASRASFKIVKHVPARIKTFARTFLLFILFSATVLIEAGKLYGSHYKYIVLIYSCILLAVALFMTDGRPSLPDWENSVPKYWLVLCMLMCVSDFLVPKGAGWIGYIFLAVFGILYFNWGNMRRPDEFIKDILRALQWCYILVIVLCIFRFPPGAEMRYAGFSNNSSVFAMYIVVFMMASLARVDYQMRSKPGLRQIIFPLIEISVGAFFLWKCQAAGPLLVCLAVTLIYLFRIFYSTLRKSISAGDKKRIALILLLAGILSLAAVFAVRSVIAGDIGGAITESRVWNKFTASGSLNTMLSGRITYWKAYMRNMNWYGHGRYLRAWKPILPHNAVLDTAYMYGVCAAVPYVLLFAAALRRAWTGDRQSYGAAPFLLIASCFMMSMSDNVELKFKWLPWIVEWLMIGVFFKTYGAEENRYDAEKRI